MRAIARVIVLTSGVVVGVMVGAAAQGHHGAQVQTPQPQGRAAGAPQAAPQNLKVLPNYAADEKPTKDVARKMIHMVMHINEEHLKGVGSEAPSAPPPPAGAAPAAPGPQAPPPLGNGAQKVSCYTCHRGSLKVATAPAGGGN